jgi:hypothetical protein
MLYLWVFHVHVHYLQALSDVHSFTLDAFLKRSLKNWKNSMFETRAKFFSCGNESTVKQSWQKNTAGW